MMRQESRGRRKLVASVSPAMLDGPENGTKVEDRNKHHAMAPLRTKLIRAGTALW
jgi:hypothetical protein